jgi:hypothetical protein
MPVLLLDVGDQIGVAHDRHDQDSLPRVPALVRVLQHVQDVPVLDGQE